MSRPAVAAPSPPPAFDRGGPNEESATDRTVALSAQGLRIVSEFVPRTAAQSEPDINRVLRRAAALYQAEQQQWIVQAARGTWGRATLASVSTPMKPVTIAAPLKDEARRALSSQRTPGEALDLHLQAFGADPYDAEMAGNLASLYLQVRPREPHLARQLAMHALALTSAQMRAPRAQDWGTFAVASALTGRDDDATYALFVAAAVASNIGNTCRTALGAVATYGERMRVPVESMLLRIHEQGRDRESAYCTFPPRWNFASRFY